MYAIYKLCPANQDFIKSLGNDTKQTAFALAKAICDSFHIPSSPLDDPITYYKEHLFGAIKNKLSFINEMTVIDIDLVNDMTQVFWNIRYATVYPSEKLFLPMPGAGISPFFGYQTKLAASDYEYIEKNIVSIVKLLNGFKLVLKDLSSCDSKE